MSDEEAMLAKVAEDGNALKYASDKWRNNTKVVLAVAAKRGCVPAAGAGLVAGQSQRRGWWDSDSGLVNDCYEYDGWMPLLRSGQFSVEYNGAFGGLFPLVHAAPVLKGAPTLRRVAGIVDDVERAAACADPATVWAVGVEQQAIAIRTGTLDRHDTEEWSHRSNGDPDDAHRWMQCGCYDEDGCYCEGDAEFTGCSIRRVAGAAEKVAASQAASLQIVAAGSGDTYSLPAGWWAVPGGDLVAQALAQHPALAEAGQRFHLAAPGEGNGPAAAATVPLLLSGPTPPKAVLVWLADGEDAPAPAPAHENKNVMDWECKEAVLAKVAADGCTLQYASAELRDNKEVVLAAVTEHGRALCYASSGLQSDKAVVLAAAAAPFAPRLGSFVDMCGVSAALSADTDVIRAAGQTAFADSIEHRKEEWEKGVWDMASVLARIPNGLQKDSMFWSAVCALPPWELPDDEWMVLATVTGYGAALRHASDQLKGDKKVALAAVNQDGRALEHVSDELEDDEQLILAAAIPGPRSRHSELLHDAADFKLDREEFLSALSESRTWPADLPDCGALALKHAPAEFQCDRAFIVAAAALSGEALAGVPALLKADVELRLSLVSKLGDSLASLGHAPPALLASPSLQQVAGIVDDAERAAACADPATVWAVDVEQQAIAISTGAALAGGTGETDAEFWLSSDDDDDDDHYMQCSCEHQDEACKCPCDHTAEFTAELVAELEQIEPGPEPLALAKAKDALLKFEKPFDEVMRLMRLSLTDYQEYTAQRQLLSDVVTKATVEADVEADAGCVAAAGGGVPSMHGTKHAWAAAARVGVGDAMSTSAGDSNTEHLSWGPWFNTAPLEADAMAEVGSDDEREASPEPGGLSDMLVAPRAICDCWESDHWGSCCVVVEAAVDEAAERVATSMTHPLQIVDISGNAYPLAAGWWSVPGGDLVAQALAQHAALVEAGQQFELVTADGTATAVTVPLLLSGPIPPKAALIWLSNDDADATAAAPATKRPRVEQGCAAPR